MPEASDAPWWQWGTIYQIYPRSFQDSNGDGIGDLQGVIDRLSYLSTDLQIDAIWLSPFYPSPMADFGYDVADYCGVDPIFGTLADWDALITAAHASDIRVIIDFVPNHSSDQHLWFQESRSARDNPRRDWYVWRDPKPDGLPPNNWIASFGGSAWEWDERTGQYFLHSFLPQQPDLNWRNPDVCQAMFEVLTFWLDRGVDGFRIDVAHLIMKDPDLRDNPVNLKGTAGHRPVGDYDSQVHIHDRGHGDVHEVYREMRRLLDRYSAERPRVSIGEIHIFDWAEWTQYYGAELDELHLPFNFRLLPTPWQATEVKQVVDELEAALPHGAWPNWVLGNHDEHRIASRVGTEQARVAQMLLLTLRGTPTLYYGDELGMTDVPIPPDREQDPWGMRVPGLDLGRDPQRTPMQWDVSPHAGFCLPTADPWLPVADDYRQRNVTVQQQDPRSMLSLVRALLVARRAHAALHLGSYHPIQFDSTDCFAYERRCGNERLVVILNFSANDHSVNLPTLSDGQVLLSTYLDRQDAIQAGELVLRPHEGVIVRPV
ncbi:MAG: alpha-amylase family glycosyl hydrolase [Chloroflexota bacterium]